MQINYAVVTVQQNAARTIT